ncbi:MAG: hypothetical protein V3V75_06365, partial [Thermoguttaceae bacterium]
GMYASVSVIRRTCPRKRGHGTHDLFFYRAPVSGGWLGHSAAVPQKVAYWGVASLRPPATGWF